MNTRTLLTATALLLLSTLPALGQNPPVDTAYVAGKYQVFTGAGAASSLDEIVRAMADKQVVFIGEAHDDPTGHMLERELFTRAAVSYSAVRPMALSLEFFERDVQLPLDEYLSGIISESSFRTASRPWPRYQSDYRPLVEFAKEQKIPVIAANAPRRYISMVSRQGRDSLNKLSKEARVYLAPLPYGKASTAYRSQWIAMMGEVMEQEGKKCGIPSAAAPAPMGAHGNMGNQLDSQVLWDATMAHSIAQHLKRQPKALVLHMVGGFHVERFTGTPEQLQSYMPKVSFMVVSLRPVADVAKFEAAPAGQWGDFVIQTDKARTLEEIECRQLRASKEKP